MEESLLEIIEPEATGLMNIPEGGNFNRSVQVNDVIPKRQSLHTYEESNANEITQEVESEKQFNSIKRV